MAAKEETQVALGINRQLLVPVVEAAMVAAVPVQASAHVAAMAVPVVTAVAAIPTMMIAIAIMEPMALQVLLVELQKLWAISMWTRLSASR